MTHGTSDGTYTWCGDPVALAKGWARDREEVECLDCLHAEVKRLEAKLAKVVEAVRASHPTPCTDAHTNAGCRICAALAAAQEQVQPVGGSDPHSTRGSA